MLAACNDINLLLRLLRCMVTIAACRNSSGSGGCK
jgi:hypothetical protein